MVQEQDHVLLVDKCSLSVCGANIGLTCPFGELLLPPTFSVFGLVLLVCGGLTSSLHILAQLSCRGREDGICKSPRHQNWWKHLKGRQRFFSIGARNNYICWHTVARRADKEGRLRLLLCVLCCVIRAVKFILTRIEKSQWRYRGGKGPRHNGVTKIVWLLCVALMHCVSLCIKHHATTMTASFFKEAQKCW